MSQSTPPSSLAGQAHGLDLVREVLFGAERRQTNEEFAALKAQLSQLSERFDRELAKSNQAWAERLNQLSAQTEARFKQLEATVADNAKRGADALASARAALEAQHQAHLKALAEERAGMEARQAAFVAHLRQALHALEGGQGST